MFLRNIKIDIPGPGEALVGRDTPMPVAERHTVLGTPLRGPWPEGLAVAVLGMGCFWGAERLFWTVDGVHSTAVGYAGGSTPNPTYEEVCTGLTGHAEVVQIVFDPHRVPYERLLRIFWEHHDPTQGMRQGNDIGTQYRSAIYAVGQPALRTAQASRAAFAPTVRAAGFGEITTEIAEAGPFYHAEDHHQQYLSDAKHPDGYCSVGPNGLTCPIGVTARKL
ncbi:MAG: peptide-methionine (S)-S-oxide reductase MsrA [Dactylosporangium sp.]|nr:peptide-methionine (S)-S-oxide reductase MsrA [Dactylosporangium sp.]NNJ63381.1 peptide-methionine (S)-S-oxide reductase MsrA [Dactylosporangium sp.]